MAAAKNELVMTATKLPHIFLCDIDDSGLLKEIAVVKKFGDGSVYYIDVDPLHQIDKARLKKIVTGMHATKYELWQLMAQSKLSNGMNALDFFHANCVKVKRPKGARSSSSSLSSVSGNVGDSMIGSDFVNPSEVNMDPNTQVFGD